MASAEETRERILVAADALLRRYGPAKTTVADVARSLNMSHANIYRHFASKADLQGAIVQRWLQAIAQPLATIAKADGPAAERVMAWLLTLIESKRQKVTGDPELFATYHSLAEAAGEVVQAHISATQAQLAGIVQDGINRGEFAPGDALEIAGVIFDATTRFIHHHHVRASGSASLEPEARRVIALLLRGLAAEQ
jgi:AcrR family transcriptional regulator